jgi:VanZ family protein
MVNIKRFFWPTAAVVFLTFIFWIIFRADTGQPTALSSLVRHLPFGDKMGHFLLYGMLAFLVNLALKNRKLKVLGRSCLLGSVMVLVFALLEECTQALLPTRNFELWDMVCDTLGIVLFSAFALRFDTWQKRFYISNIE